MCIFERRTEGERKEERKKESSSSHIVNKEVFYKINIFCLLETRVQERNSAAIISLFSDWNWVHNYHSHPLGRIWLFSASGYLSICY